MTPEEKLEKIEELLAARDEITAEILEVLGATPENDEEVDEAPRAKPEKAKKSVKKREPCDDCGSIGSRHFKTCSKTASTSKRMPPSNASGRTILDEALRLNEQEFIDVRASLYDGIPIPTVAFSYPDVSIDEVRKASDSDTYDDYLSKK